MSFSQLEKRLYVRDQPIDEGFHGSRHTVHVDRASENQDVSTMQFQQKHLHIIILDTFARCFCPTASIAEARIHLKLRNVEELNIDTFLLQSFEKRIQDQSSVTLLHKRTAIERHSLHLSSTSLLGLAHYVKKYPSYSFLVLRLNVRNEKSYSSRK